MPVPRTASTARRLLLTVLAGVTGVLALVLSLVPPVLWLLAGLAAAGAVVAALAPAGGRTAEPATEPAAVPASGDDAATVLTV